MPDRLLAFARLAYAGQSNWTMARLAAWSRRRLARLLARTAG